MLFMVSCIKSIFSVSRFKVTNAMEICSFVCEVNSLRQAACIFLLQHRMGTRTVDVSAEAKYSGAMLFCTWIVSPKCLVRSCQWSCASFLISVSHLRKAKESCYSKEGKNISSSFVSHKTQSHMAYLILYPFKTYPYIKGKKYIYLYLVLHKYALHSPKDSKTIRFHQHLCISNEVLQEHQNQQVIKSWVSNCFPNC